MKKNSNKRSIQPDDMRREYDFAGGVRGKHHDSLLDGYSIRIQAADGTISEKRVPPESVVSLEPDVLEYFPDSRAVNHALRTLIKLVPTKRKATALKARAKGAARRLSGKGHGKETP